MAVSAGVSAEHILFKRHLFLTGRLPAELEANGREEFEDLWALHPERFHEITQPFTG